MKNILWPLKIFTKRFTEMNHHCRRNDTLKFAETTGLILFHVFKNANNSLKIPNSKFWRYSTVDTLPFPQNLTLIRCDSFRENAFNGGTMDKKPVTVWSLRWLILATYNFFLELAMRLEYNAVQILTTRFKYYKRVLNISNAFEIFKTCFKYYKRVLNICNAFETFKMRFKYYKRVLNIINVFWILATRLKLLKRG